jgi:hypothetical protein
MRPADTLQSVPDLLPDSRPRVSRGGVRGPDGKTRIPVYCANCGKQWGMVPEEHITFAFVLCDPCAATHGDIAHTYKEPDDVFWERIRNASLEHLGDEPLSLDELTKQLADPSSDFSKLAAEWRANVERTQK